jgi:hypothetical protein
MSALLDVSHLQRRHHLRALTPELHLHPTKLTLKASYAQVYNASFDESLAHPAKVHLLQCMEALKEMEVRQLMPSPPDRT